MSLPASSRQPDDSSVTMLDVLNNEKELEEETAAVLGGSDEKNCTYDQVGTEPRLRIYDDANTPFNNSGLREATGPLLVSDLFAGVP